MKDFLYFSLSILLLSFKYVINKVQYSDSFIAFYEGRVDENNFKLLQDYGYILDKQIDIGPGFYRFIRNGTKLRTRLAPPKTINLNDLQRKDPKLLSFHQERLWFREKKSKVKTEDRGSSKTLGNKRPDVIRRSKRALTISDREWNRQWQLNPGHTPSMGVYNAWESGYTGRTVTVAIVDDGIDVNHNDLFANYNAELSFDIINNVHNASHKYYQDGHGTKCAGVVAAVKNTDCVIGTSYESSIVAIRLLDDQEGVTDSEEASALVHQLANIDIYSNSWGDGDDGTGFDSSLSDVQKAALLKGVTHGRGGKGAIYVWAAGNGGDRFDDCNVDGYVSSIYTIAVNSLAPDSSPAYYAEQCTSVLVATYGGGLRGRIATTGPYDTCVNNFLGTSAACPTAAGIIALVLQANSDLTWRDIQHMIVEYSTNTGLKNANFYTNGAGKKVSLYLGFGLMNASKMVNAASSWKNVPTSLLCEGPTSYVHKSERGEGILLATQAIYGCHIKHLEHVLVTIYFQSSDREVTSIYLESPNGTNSRLLRERYNDKGVSPVTWTFKSVHTWGENPVGTWKLRIKSTNRFTKMDLFTWKLSFYGTATNPLAGRPLDGEIGGYCDESVTCRGNKSECFNKANICVSCQAGHHYIGGKCVYDGVLGGYCIGSTYCWSSMNRCNLTSNRCVSCGNDYHVISGRCMQDGYSGGYCNQNITCVDAGTGCNRTTLTCLYCTVGYRLINNFCEQDGVLGGFCDNTTLCTNFSYNCENNICINRTDVDSSSANDNKIGVIAGATTGGIVGLFLAVAVALLVIKYRNSAVIEAPAQANNRSPPESLHVQGAEHANNYVQRY